MGSSQQEHSLACNLYSETTADGKKKKTKLGQTLLNGNNICMVSIFRRSE